MKTSDSRIGPAAAALLLAFFADFSAPAFGQEAAGGPPKSWAGTVQAPEFPEGLEWLNVPGPLSLARLRGKVVLLDFWTYGCINCIHNLPYIKKLQEEFRDELVVIGVHSAKFANEGRTENIRNIVLRYGLTHPVVNDGSFAVWQLWGASAWPTLVLIDPAGKIVGGRSGEGFYDAFRAAIVSLIAEFDAKKQISREALNLRLEREAARPTVLSYPGKLAVDAKGGRLFIADSGHNRIVAARLADGEILSVIGDGTAGLRDGSYAEARFDTPHGLALGPDGSTLYVADTENHALRAVDLASATVRTLAGSGRLAAEYPPEPGVGTSVALSSPWDLAVRDGALYVAMAGSHQLWKLDLATLRAEPYAGSGSEGFEDGPLDTAELAQPSGLAPGEDGRLYFADSEGSSIRYADPRTNGVRTLAGSGKSLFEFGSNDGLGRAALFQHPLGLVWYAGSLYVADTYNSLVRKIDPSTGAVTTLAGGQAGFRNGRQALFNEPGGIAAAFGRLYLADTNNHTIRVIDLGSLETSSLVLKGVEKLKPAAAGPPPLRLAPITVASGRGTIVVDIGLPKGFKPNAEAASSFSFSLRGSGLRFSAGAEIIKPGPTLPIELPVEFSSGAGTLELEVNLVYCEADKDSLCYLERRKVELPFTAGAAGAKELKLAWSVEGLPVP